MRYKNPAPTTNIIIYDGNRICLVRRRIEPHKGRAALPGGFVDYNETVEAAAVREAKEETGLDIELVSILGVYSDPSRNPSKHTISTVFVARPIGGELTDNEEGVPSWEDLSSLPDLAFDHKMIISDFRKCLNKAETFWSSKV